MQNTRYKIGLVIFAVFAGLLLEKIFTKTDPDKEIFLSLLHERMTPGKRIPVRELTNFEWDKVCIAEGYQELSRFEVDHHLPTIHADTKRVPEGQNYLVFIKGNATKIIALKTSEFSIMGYSSSCMHSPQLISKEQTYGATEIFATEDAFHHLKDCSKKCSYIV